MSYVDEGNFLHPAFRLVKKGGWDPRSYLYPQLPVVTVTAAARAFDPVYRRARGVSLRDRIPTQAELYDELEPFALLLIARCMSVALGLAIVVLTGLLASRLAGPPAGAAAALLAALTPALVLRGSNASVDPYAALFCLLCLCATDLSRTSRRPGLTSLLAGAMAGAAFASKYPSAAVITAFGLTTLLLPIPCRERLRRLSLAAVGLVAGGLSAMPAIHRHPRDVYEAIARQAAFYAELSSPRLWRQALLRAEWDIPYERAELGFAFTAAAAAGIAFGLRDRRLRPTLWGWCAFAAVHLAIHGSRSYQPFRNLLPLVPIACAAVAIFFGRLRDRALRPARVDAAALAWVLLAFAAPLAAYVRARHALRDPRALAVDWLAAHAQPDDEILFVHDLGFLRQEIARLRARPEVKWWDEVEPEVRSARPRFIVGGVLANVDGSLVEVASLPSIAGAYTTRLRAGSKPTAPFRAWWRGNDQIVEVLERRE